MDQNHDPETPPQPIPGEHDVSTLTHRQPGAMGGQFNGADALPVPDEVEADAATREEWARDGGGSPGERKAGRRAGRERADEHGATRFEPTRPLGTEV